jgi:hypothetical protein
VLLRKSHNFALFLELSQIWRVLIILYPKVKNVGRRSKVVNILVDTYGNYLGTDKGCVILRDKTKKEQKYPLFEAEIGEIVLTSGNKRGLSLIK